MCRHDLLVVLLIATHSTHAYIQPAAHTIGPRLLQPRYTGIRASVPYTPSGEVQFAKVPPTTTPSDASESPKRMSTIDAVSIIAGTAIGGGFLALPYSTAPAGAIPSSATLGACWLVLVLESLLISDLVLDHRATAAAASDTLSEDSDALATPSFATLGNAAFGAAGGSAVGVTFVVLMITTLVSQLAKGSALLSPTLAGLPSGVRCALLAGTFGAFGRGSSQRLLSRVNGALALGFLASTASLFGQAVPLAAWERLGRADWSACWQSAPTLLQLHVYSEVCMHMHM